MFIPPGYSTVFPYFLVADADGFCRFLVDGLGGEEIDRTLDGERIVNAQVRIGTGTVMVSEASDALPPMPASYYLYVADADGAHGRALSAGAVKIMPVADRPYGDRQSGVRDPWGNIWWISQRLAEGPYR
ncbi:VOC family protein [Sphingobium subterraneum]|uniref:PhnB protein n=1 Tax=Sphingobium subterraneum TaxID=627688 RepID=A0A841IZQ0_9SPHN|nr:VOC family protein [Sphingobium subterraneum]MBB6124067.1 PhnB protein [Sphingobium subterraneum]